MRAEPAAGPCSAWTFPVHGQPIGTVPVVVSGRLTLNVSNAGNTKAGSVILYVR